MYISEVKSCWNQFISSHNRNEVNIDSTMSRLCLFIFFLSIAVRFGDCEDVNCTSGKPGSDKTRLSEIEKIVEHIWPSNKDHAGNKSTTIGNVIKKFEKYFDIFPGTKWCGDGDIAKNNADLGRFSGTDACCRAHDECQNDILANGTEDNLINNGIFTRSACFCDHKFFGCLRNVSNEASSKIIGKIYFDILKPQCFNCACPTNNCDPNTDPSSCKGRCKKYQWVDNSKFSLFEAKESNLAKQWNLFSI